MSDVRFNKAFEAICERHEEIMGAALGDNVIDPESKASVWMCMGVFAHPELDERKSRMREPVFYFDWRGSEPTAVAKNQLQDRCLSAAQEYGGGKYYSDFGLIVPVEDEIDYYVIPVFAMMADGDPNGLTAINEDDAAEALSGKINAVLGKIPPFLKPDDAGRGEPEDRYAYDTEESGNVRVYDGYYGKLLS